MNKTQVERFFKVVSERYPRKCRVILTGAAAGALYGRVRATMDIDFSAKTADWTRFSNAIREASLQTGIAAQFAEDIDRWSPITLMDYQRHIYLQKKFQGVEIYLMETPYWAIGKLSRYLDSDIQDLVKVFKKTHTSWQDAASVAGRALRRSPKSTSCILFGKQVENFLRRFGRRVWGRAFDREKAVSLFRKYAGVR